MELKLLKELATTIHVVVLEKYLKIIFLKIENLFFGLFLNQKKSVKRSTFTNKISTR